MGIFCFKGKKKKRGEANHHLTPIRYSMARRMLQKYRRAHWALQVPSCVPLKRHFGLAAVNHPRRKARHVSPPCQCKSHGRKRKSSAGLSGSGRDCVPPQCPCEFCHTNIADASVGGGRGLRVCVCAHAATAIMRQNGATETRSLSSDQCCHRHKLPKTVCVLNSSHSLALTRTPAEKNVVMWIAFCVTLL